MASHGVSKSVRDKTEQQKEAEREKIQKYRSLEDEFRQLTSQGEFDDSIFQLTTKLLRINPEYYTVWNARRRCLLSGKSSKFLSSPKPTSETIESKDSSATNADQQGATAMTIDTVKSELMFTVPLLMEHPKCYWIWNYRMWMLDQATNLLPTSISKTVWVEELALISKMLSRDERNYHAWAYRRFVVSQLELPLFGGESMAESEFEYTTKRLQSNFSNFSAWHNRSELIPKLVKLRSLDTTARKEFLDAEFEYINGAINLSPEDQSLWYYHQFLVANITTTDTATSIVPDLSTADRVADIQREIEGIKDLLEDYTDVNWIYVSLLEYSLAICRLEKQSPKENLTELPQWLGKIKELDHLQAGRWNELAAELQIS
ncbi:hypothetical protein VHEMI01429 [[Torrubiella] hemipterigena]|uniref:Geranylgeranyl transferase type-2 subunit alpha n=2 Tax=[Torrubiella] hemipterigena TaxID=1531966 RepID=A0A0A1SLW6_9HYPO|nr:hypothetical protein VHEMI01429 [[Torrubiella] hemipterigena]